MFVGLVSESVCCESMSISVVSVAVIVSVGCECLVGALWVSGSPGILPQRCSFFSVQTYIYTEPRQRPTFKKYCLHVNHFCVTSYSLRCTMTSALCPTLTLAYYYMPLDGKHGQKDKESARVSKHPPTRSLSHAWNQPFPPLLVLLFIMALFPLTGAQETLCSGHSNCFAQSSPTQEKLKPACTPAYRTWLSDWKFWRIFMNQLMR